MASEPPEEPVAEACSEDYVIGSRKRNYLRVIEKFITQYSSI